ncbi:MAG: hypothetical protein GTO41_20000 [Burkholderiales bacterium]|nr:hypothetical protein [Burkholderiales bacterium]
MTIAGSILIGIEANTEELRKDLARSKKQLKGFEDSAKDAADKGAAEFEAAMNILGKTVDGVAAAWRRFQQDLGEVDELNKASRALGLTADELTVLRIAASDAGQETNNLEQFIIKLNRRTARATNQAESASAATVQYAESLGIAGDAIDEIGAGEAGKAFVDLGLSAEKLAKLPTGQRLLEIARAFQDIDSASQRGKILQDLGDRTGRLGELLDGLAGRLDVAGERAKQAGLLFGDTLGPVEDANDAFAQFNRVIDSLTKSISVDFAPELQAISEGMSEFIFQVRQGIQVFRAFGSLGVIRNLAPDFAQRQFESARASVQRGAPTFGETPATPEAAPPSVSTAAPFKKETH